LGSFEIGNLGVSSPATVPTLSVSPYASTVGTSALASTIPTVTSQPAVSSTTTGALPCPTTGLTGTPGGC
jgi:hypothetical protein